MDNVKIAEYLRVILDCKDKKARVDYQPQGLSEEKEKEWKSKELRIASEAFIREVLKERKLGNSIPRYASEYLWNCFDEYFQAVDKGTANSDQLARSFGLNGDKDDIPNTHASYRRAAIPYCEGYRLGTQKQATSRRSIPRPERPFIKDQPITKELYKDIYTIGYIDGLSPNPKLCALRVIEFYINDIGFARDFSKSLMKKEVFEDMKRSTYDPEMNTIKC